MESKAFIKTKIDLKLVLIYKAVVLYLWVVYPLLGKMSNLAKKENEISKIVSAVCLSCDSALLKSALKKFEPKLTLLRNQ